MAPASPARLAGGAFLSMASCSARGWSRGAWLVCLGALLVFVELPQRAQACSCVGVPSASDAREGVDVVFLGEALSVQRISRLYIDTRFRVDAIWEGEKRDYITLRTLEDSAMCGRSYPTGRSYLVYALRTDQRGFSDHGCSRTCTTAESIAYERAALGRPRWMRGPRQDNQETPPPLQRVPRCNLGTPSSALRSGAWPLFSLLLLGRCRKPSRCR